MNSFQMNSFLLGRSIKTIESKEDLKRAVEELQGTGSGDISE